MESQELQKLFLLIFGITCLTSCQAATGPSKITYEGLFLSPMFLDGKKMLTISRTKHPEGEDLTLLCRAIGSPKLTYRWLVNGEPFRKVYRKHLRRDQTTLRIKRLRSTDQGIYTCIASNQYGNLSFSYHLQIKDEGAKKPEFYDRVIMARQQYTFRGTGHSIRFRCQAKGSHPIKYKWLKNGEAIELGSRVTKGKMEIKEWDLRIRKLSLMDGGNYTCISENQYGSAQFSFFLTMLRTRSGGPPRVIVRNPEPVVKAEIGQNVSLECLELTSHTLPFVIWHKWKLNVEERTALKTILSGVETNICQRIDPRKYGTFTVESTEELNKVQWLDDQTQPYGLRLSLAKVTQEDSGFYTCTASNNVGEGLAKIELRVGGNIVKR